MRLCISFMGHTLIDVLVHSGLEMPTSRLPTGISVLEEENWVLMEVEHSLNIQMLIDVFTGGTGRRYIKHYGARQMMRTYQDVEGFGVHNHHELDIVSVQG